MHGMIRKLEQIDGNKFCSFKGSQLILARFHAEVPQVSGVTQIIGALSKTTTLNAVEISNYNISSKTGDDLAYIFSVIINCKNYI